jgi:hypothetical protein
MFERMQRSITRLAIVTLLAVVPALTRPAFAQSGAAPTVLRAPEATKVLPSSVFFKRQSAPVQLRNSGGVKFADGAFVLAALVDNSGYSTAVQQKYQAYLIAEVPVEINGHPLPPGAYGVGFVQGHFGVMDIGGHDLFAVESTRDTELKRPTPLQVIADPTQGKYRLYQGRDYIVITRP